MSSRSPRVYYDYSIDLDDENSVIVIPDVLNDQELREYIWDASEVLRARGNTAFNTPKPRLEVAYTVDGEPFTYSRRRQYTTEYPEHVMKIIPKLLEEVSMELGEDVENWELSTGIDIVYPAEFPGSGSIGAHSDDEEPWELILVFSLGQTRYFRIQPVEGGESINVELPHNSLIAMYGPTFQQKYTHRIDRLGPRDEPGDRHSLNIRFFRPS